MNSYLYSDPRYTAQPSHRPMKANEINNRVRRIQRSEASGSPYNLGNSYSDGYEGGTINLGSGSSAGSEDFVANVIMGLLLGFAGSDE